MDIPKAVRELARRPTVSMRNVFFIHDEMRIRAADNAQLLNSEGYIFAAYSAPLQNLFQKSADRCRRIFNRI
jgi:hypothetical protein